MKRKMKTLLVAAMVLAMGLAACGNQKALNGSETVAETVVAESLESELFAAGEESTEGELPTASEEGAGNELPTISEESHDSEESTTSEVVGENTEDPSSAAEVASETDIPTATPGTAAEVASETDTPANASDIAVTPDTAAEEASEAPILDTSISEETETRTEPEAEKEVEDTAEQVVTDAELLELIALMNQKMQEDITVRIVSAEANQTSAQESAETPAQESAEAPAQESAETPAQESAEAPAQEPADVPNQEPATVSTELALAQEAFRLVNEQRAAAGLSALTWDDDLYEGAKVRAQEASVCWSHTRPDGSACFTVSDKCHGENLASGYSSASKAVSGWMGSQGHKENILRSEFTVGAMAVYNDNGCLYWCNLFGR